MHKSIINTQNNGFLCIKLYDFPKLSTDYNTAVKDDVYLPT